MWKVTENFFNNPRGMPAHAMQPWTKPCQFEDSQFNLASNSSLSGGSVTSCPNEHSLFQQLETIVDFSMDMESDMSCLTFDFVESIYTPSKPLATGEMVKTENASTNTPAKTQPTSFAATGSQPMANPCLSSPLTNGINMEYLDLLAQSHQVTSNDGTCIDTTSRFDTTSQDMTCYRVCDTARQDMTCDSTKQNVTTCDSGRQDMTCDTARQNVTCESGRQDLACESVLPNIDLESEQLQEKFSLIQTASQQLEIPRSPWLWNVEQVNKWVNWLFKTQYKITPMFSLNMGGSKLCVENDLRAHVNGQTRAADIISAEIDIWKQSFRIETEILATIKQHEQECTQLQPQLQYDYDSMEAEKVYFDLNCNRPVSSENEKHTNSSILEIPTPVSTHTGNDFSSITVPVSENQQPMRAIFNHSSPSSTLPVHIQQMSPVSRSPSFHGRDSPRFFESSGVGTGGDYSSTDEEMREHSPTPTESSPAARGSIPHSRNSIKLWQFLRYLLDQPGCTCIRWLDRSKGIFKIEDSKKVAELWGQRKNRPAMNYDKLSRSIRQYYKKNIIKKTDDSRRLIYQFCAPYL